MNRFIAGTVGGVVATYAMTEAMAFLQRRLPNNRGEPLPPRAITEGALSGARGHRHNDAEINDSGSNDAWADLSLAAHFAFGAATGAAFGLLGRKPGIVPGALYGLAVWAGSYLGWVPALGIMPPATRQKPQRNALMIAVHLVWGATLQLATARLARTGTVFGETPTGAGRTRGVAPRR